MSELVSDAASNNQGEINIPDWLQAKIQVLSATETSQETVRSFLQQLE